MLKKRWVKKNGFFSRSILKPLSPALLFFYLLLPSISGAQGQYKPTIDNILLTQCQENLCINFSLSHGLTEEIDKILLSGIPVRYVFEIKLEKKRFLWNEELQRLELLRTITFDNIRNEYIVTFYYPSTRIVTVSTLKEAKEYLLTVDHLPFISLSRLKKGQKYYIQIKASAKKGESSIPFGHLVKMFSSFGFSTDSYEIEFRY